MTKIMNGSKSVREPRSLVAGHISSIPKSGIREFFDLVSTMEDVISLGVGEPDFVTPWAIRESGIFSLEQGHTAYTSNLGLLQLRREIARYVNGFFRVKYDPETEILVTIGVSEGLDAAIRAITEIGDQIIYHEPCFVSYPAEIRMAHGVPVPVKTRVEDGFAVTAEAIAEVITPRTKAILLNFPCNPTGAVMEETELRKIAALAVRHDLAVITDEIYSELTYDGKHVSIAALPGMRERTILLHGFSKAFAMTGLRIGYACAPARLIDPMMKIHQYSIMSAGTTSQEAALEALRSGIGPCGEMREEYRVRRDIMVKSFNDLGLDCLTPHGAFYTFPSIKSTGMNSHDFAKGLLQAERVVVVPGSAFGESGEGFVRCCYATSLDEIKQATERIARYLATLKR